MQSESLDEAIISSLDRVGRVQVSKLAPELGSLDGWTMESLVKLMTDSSTVIYDEDGLLSLRRFFYDFETVQINFDEVEEKRRFDKITHHLAEKLRYQPSYLTTGLLSQNGEQFGGISAFLGTKRPGFLPIVAINIGQVRGPIHAAIDSIYDSPQPNMTKSMLAERLVHNLLRLWRQVLAMWIPPILQGQETTESDHIPDSDNETEKLAHRIKAETPEVIKEETIDQVITDEVEPQRGQRVNTRKRARSPEGDDDDLSERDVKRQVMTPSPTPAIEGTLVSREWVHSVLDGLGSLSPPGDLVDITYTFRRERFATTFGGGGQGLETRWARQAKYPNRPADAQSEWLIGANSAFNPYLPRSPCAPGLIFRAPGLTTEHGNAVPLPSTRTVSIKVSAGRWLYLGEYVIKHRGSLPLTEWTALTNRIKDEWIDYSVTHYAMDGQKGPKITSKEMRERLDDGDLSLEVYEMQCVGYIVSLQAKIIELGLSKRTFTSS